MATGTNLVFNHTALLLAQSKLDFTTAGDMRVVACSVLPVATNTLKSQLTVSTNLAAATIALTSEGVSTTSTKDCKFDAANVTFTASGGSSTIAGFAIYTEVATSPLDALVLFGDVDTATASITLAAGEKLTLSWNAAGILKLNA
jgi:hypothetical protein